MNRQGMVKKVSSVTARLAGLTATVCALITTSAVTVFAGGYTFTDLGTLPGYSSSYAYSINNSGQVVGYSATANGDSRATLFSNGTVTDLGTLGGTSSKAYSINNSGQVCGWAQTADPFQHAALFSNGTVTDLAYPPVRNAGYAYSINNSGQVVVAGSAIYVGDFIATLYNVNNGTVTNLGTLPGGYSEAFGINDYGQAVGVSKIDYESGRNHAVLFSNGTITDLGTLGGGYSYAYSINNAGQAVGWATSQDDKHAALFSNGTVTDLGTLPGYLTSSAMSINNSGQAVGYALNNYSPSHATLFSNGTVTDLNSVIDSAINGYLAQALGINDSGQIVGYGYIDGQEHAFLLTPYYGHLSITKTGTGIGSVTSNPPGIDCSASCSSQGANFLLDTVVSIAATPFFGGSIFVGWSGDSDCSDGIVTMNTDISCSATFDLCGYPALIGATPYDSIGAAYAYAAASGDTIQVTASNQMEMVNFTLSKNITLDGGYDCAFSNLLSYTTIKGSLTISNGTVTIANIAIN